HRNFIIGLSVGIPAFLLLCVCITVTICCFTTKKKREKEKEPQIPLHDVKVYRKKSKLKNYKASSPNGSKRPSNKKQNKPRFIPDKESLWVTNGDMQHYSTRTNRPDPQWRNNPQTHNRYQDTEYQKPMPGRYYNEPYPDYM
ncbi:unnamed protein product, partial [Lymnaea stagnalis]